AAGPRRGGRPAHAAHRHAADPGARRRRDPATPEEPAPLGREHGAAGIEVAEVVTAGTPAFPAAREHPGLATLPETIHRVSPGTVVYHDLRSTAQNPDVPAEFAATVLTRVASLPGEDRFTCDAGSKAIEAAAPDMIAAALEIPSARCLGQSEEHTVFQSVDVRPARGALLRLVPGHVCPTVNLANEALLVEDGRLVGRAEVTARGHGRLE
ncbi:MAG: D-TA family PLP-dependent enzyme, partial [Planctomycetota bacterium]|nr:D-TA family PLP-dependent enzyme [Planctomycetota bacterium]